MKEIGSYFYLTHIQLEQAEERLRQAEADLPKDSPNQVYLMSGRQGIRFCLEDMAAQEGTGAQQLAGTAISPIALVPEYTCASVLAPFLLAGYRLVFYPVDQDLRVSGEAMSRVMAETEPSVLLVHPYFGFDTLDQGSAIRSGPQGLKVILDSTQSWATGLAYPFWDYEVVSLRKWGALPDGALVRKKDAPFLIQAAQEENQRLLQDTKAAYGLKERYLTKAQGEKADLLAAFARLNAHFDQIDPPRTMSRFSRVLFSQMLAEESLWQEQRRRNYQVLADWKGWARLGRVIFPKLSDEVPLYFPVSLEQRGEIQQYLSRQGVFCPVIWPVPENVKVPVVSDSLAYLRSTLLCVPMDQRYGREEMERILALLEGFAPGRA